MRFIGKNVPCTRLSEPVRVRLFREDLDQLTSAEIDVQAFIQRAVNIQVRILVGYSIMRFIGKNVPCTRLSEPVRVRLFREDLDQLTSAEIDVQAFIQRAVNIQVRILKKWR